MSHILDRPAWNALQGPHADLAEGGALARRYPPSIIPFAAAKDDSAESLQALAALAAPGETLVQVEAAPLPPAPAHFEVVTEARLVQMVLAEPAARTMDPRIERLGHEDREAMLALAELTKPGPFTRRAQDLGPFWGVRVDGRLVAMAGQRMHVEGMTELSGVCTHPDFQGKGLGRLLMQFVAGEICARNEGVFLHAYETNTSAIALYTKLGFVIRSPMNMRVVKRPA